MDDLSPRAPDSDHAPPQREAAATSIATLEAELEATPESRGKAYLHLELGVLHEQALDDAGGAVRHYLAAFNQDSALRPALNALIDIFEQRRSLPNLLRLYKAEVNTCDDPAELARAHVDLALLRRVLEGDDGRSLSHAKLAIELCPTDPYVATAAEYLARVAGDPADVIDALAAREIATSEPELRALLMLDRAAALESAGAVDEASAVLESAAALPSVRDRVFRAMERHARKYELAELLVRALEGQADLAAGEVRGSDYGLSKAVFGNPTHAAAATVALLVEAARLRLDALGDVAGATLVMDQAVATRPEDLALRLEHLAIAARAGEPARAAALARALIERFDVGPMRAPLLCRVAEHAVAEGRAEEAAAAFAAADLAAEGSPFVSARIERQLRTLGDRRALVDRLLLAHDAVLDGATAFEAALHRAHGLGDLPAAEPLFRLAAQRLGDPSQPLRELYGAAFDLGGREDRVRAIESLLSTRALDAEERSALWYELVRLLGAYGEEGTRRLELLAEAVEDELAATWAADVARVSAAETGSFELLAKAHSSLAQVADGEARAAHLAAAARAELLGGAPEAAMARLRDLLQKMPTHPYGVSLLEQILRGLGRHEEAEAVLEEAAAKGKGMEVGLLAAAARAEIAGNAEAAAGSYERAMAAAPESASPALGLYRLATKTGRLDWSRAALGQLAAQEASSGEISLASLLNAEHLALVEGDGAGAAAALSCVPDDSPSALAAAWLSLLIDPSELDAGAAIAATEMIASRGAPDDSLALELASASLAGEVDVPTARRTLERLAPEVPDDEGAEGAGAGLDPRVAYARMRLAAIDPSKAMERPEAIIALGRSIEAPDAQAELLLHGLRAAVASGGESATDDAFLWAQSLAESTNERLEAVVAQEETVSAADDIDAYADAMEARLRRPAEDTPLEVRAAAGRALAHAGRFEEATEVLEGVVREDPSDLSAWDALRVSARGSGHDRAVVDACDRLAEAAGPQHRALLLEEAGIVCMDALGDDEGARGRFEAALEADPDRHVAYGRLHDLLAERDQPSVLLALVEGRIERSAGGEELEKLYYEKARLLRSLGRKEEALGAIQQLLQLDPEHVGAIALSVEIHVTGGAYAAAVDALRLIASAQVPAQQKKVARLGAADFLEKKLGDPAGAIAELRAIEALGLADRALYLRVAELAEAASLPDEAVWALDRAAEGTGPQAASAARRASTLRLERLGDVGGAERALYRALEADPTDRQAFRALGDLLGGGRAFEEAAERLELSLRERLTEHGLDPAALRGLREVAIALRDDDFAHVVLSSLAALGVATEDERKQLASRAAAPMLRPPASPSDALVTRFRTKGDAGPYAALAQHAYEALIDADSLVPGRYGVGRAELIGGRTPNALREELSAIAGAFGLEPGEFYVGGPKPTQLVAVPAKNDVVHWVVGAQVASPLPAADRFHAGRQAAAVSAHTLPLVSRTPADAGALLFAAAAVAGVPLAAGAGRTGVAEWARALDRVMPRKTRKAISDWAATVDDGGAGVIDYCRAARVTSLRAGLVVSADLYVTLRLLLGREPSFAFAQQSPDVRELVLFWLSRPALALRRELGVAS